MKKIHKIIILIFVVLIIIVSILLFSYKKDDNLTGKEKGEKTVAIEPSSVIRCDLNSDYGNYKIKSSYEIHSKDGATIYVSAKEEIIAKNDEVLEFQSDLVKVMYESSNNLYGGYEIKIDHEEDKVSFDVKIDYTKMNVERYLEDQLALKNYYKNGVIEDKGVKVYYESRGAICKED